MAQIPVPLDANIASTTGQHDNDCLGVRGSRIENALVITVSQWKIEYAFARDGILGIDRRCALRWLSVRMSAKRERDGAQDESRRDVFESTVHGSFSRNVTNEWRAIAGMGRVVWGLFVASCHFLHGTIDLPR